jgi:hypothetical protein
MRGKERTCPSTKVDKIMVGSVPSTDWKTLADGGQKQGTSRVLNIFHRVFHKRLFQKSARNRKRGFHNKSTITAKRGEAGREKSDLTHARGDSKIYKIERVCVWEFA